MLPTLAQRVRANLAAHRIIGTLRLGRDRRDEAPRGGAEADLPAQAPPLEAPRTAEDVRRPTDTRAVIVLGGGSDLGIAIAAEFVARGAEAVVLAGRNPEVMREQALEAGIGVRIETVVFDARQTESHVGAVEEAFTLAGDVQAVVLAFGVPGDNQSYEANPALAAGAAVANFAGAVSASLAAVRALARQRQAGTLIVLSSIAAVRPQPSNYVYGATKAGLDFFARGLAASVKRRGVRILVVRPGIVEGTLTQEPQTSGGIRGRLFRTSPCRVARDVSEAVQRRQTVVWSPGILRWMNLPLRFAPNVVVQRAIAPRVPRGSR